LVPNILLPFIAWDAAKVGRKGGKVTPCDSAVQHARLRVTLAAVRPIRYYLMK